ncbi:CIC11C00000005574 [Sungouiella intermedia]|uniref:CIC11C00000005574 n=1 Tax=Sungouiella intermedia TaxID=45354 RepID=A0A1L0BBK7_9ASCO|nr:CIC11C00000005574 [[Candida] intermedia]SGZ58728.1 CIC11C00000005940 [[Candida] intermedia]
MSSYKQAGISLNKALSIAAQTLRNSLKAEFKVAAEKRGFTEAKAVKFENGVASEPKTLGN